MRTIGYIFFFAIIGWDVFLASPFGLAFTIWELDTKNHPAWGMIIGFILTVPAMIIGSMLGFNFD